jgi:hypothetical protein
MSIEEAIGYMALVWVINSWVKTLVPAKSKIQRFLCLKCWSFWGVLAMTQDPITAAVAALVAALIDTYMSNTKITL